MTQHRSHQANQGFTLIEVLAALEVERGHPVRVVAIKPEGQLEEGLQALPAGGRNDADALCHAEGLNPGQSELKLGGASGRG